MSNGYDLKKYAILYVDDEEQSLKYFPKLFGGDLRCLTAPSVAEARKIIDQEGDGIGVVISDQRMPGESGVELLAWLRANHPQVVRILTTAYSDLDSAISAVNTGAIFRYVIKPWEHREMYGVLARAMEFHLVQRERNMLLREKLTVLQRMVIMDRVRSFAVLAAGLSNRIKNPMLALKTFLDHAPARSATDHEDAHLQWGDLWSMAQSESQRIIEMVEAVVKKTVEPDYHFSPGQALTDLVAPALAEAKAKLGERASFKLAANTPSITADRTMVARLFQIVVTMMLKFGLAKDALAISAEGGATVWGKPAVKVSLRTGTEPWTKPQLAELFAVLKSGGAQAAGLDTDLLAAYFIAYHHSGNLLVHPAAPAGPAFEVLLPLDPSGTVDLPLERDWVDSIFNFQEE